MTTDQLKKLDELLGIIDMLGPSVIDMVNTLDHRWRNRNLYRNQVADLQQAWDIAQNGRADRQRLVDEIYKRRRNDSGASVEQIVVDVLREQGWRRPKKPPTPTMLPLATGIVMEAQRLCGGIRLTCSAVEHAADTVLRERIKEMERFIDNAGYPVDESWNGGFQQAIGRFKSDSPPGERNAQ